MGLPRALTKAEPAAVILGGLTATGLTASYVLLSKGRVPLTAVAKEHPVAVTVVFLHLVGLLPGWCDPICLGHAGLRKLLRH